MKASNDAGSLLQCPQCTLPITRCGALIPFVSAAGDGERKVTIANCTGTDDPNDTGDNATTEQQALCGICEEADAKNYCVPCGFPLCESCQQSSHQRGRYRAHEVVPLRTAHRRGPRMCVEHATMPLDLYCFSCSSCVCLTCCFGGSHKGHEVQTLDDVAEKMRMQMKGEMKTLQQLADTTRDASIKLRKQLPGHERAFALVKDKVERCFGNLRKALEERERELLQQLSDHTCQVKSDIIQRATQSEAVHDAVRSNVLRLEEFLASTEAADTVRFNEVVTRSINALETVSTHVVTESSGALRAIEERLTRHDGVASFAGDKEEDLVRAVRRFGCLQLPEALCGAPPPADGAQVASMCIAEATAPFAASQEYMRETCPEERGQRHMHQTFETLLCGAHVRNSEASTSTRPGLKLSWNDPRSSDDFMRATVPSLLLAPASSRVSTASPAMDTSTSIGVEPHLALKWKRLRSSEANDEKMGEKKMSPLKKHRTVTHLPPALGMLRDPFLSNHPVKGDGDTVEVGVVDSGASPAAMVKEGDKTLSNGSSAKGSTLQLKLRL
ncbi:putative zinc finger protein [Trypanosoma grayi]|uniref:putative zinc finger protein n=1 Tax=Trypanosoma grayi TaxID=71804 RepID=UPI0004F43A00|nr:putative zinc finger protein [Trypanosoma grayi]KEG05881.1 putative zinc finger protein [Trypanosoma grayi]